MDPQKLVDQVAEKLHKAIDDTQRQSEEMLGEAERYAEQMRADAERLRADAERIRADAEAEARRRLGEVQPGPVTVPEPEPPQTPEPVPDPTPEPAPERVPEPMPEPVPEPTPPPETPQTAEPVSSTPASANGETQEGDDSGARLVAMKLALDGTSREEARKQLAAEYHVSDLDALLDDVYAK